MKNTTIALREKMKKLITLLLCTFSLSAFSQQFITPPDIWLKADNPNNVGNLLNDFSGNNHHAVYPTNFSSLDSTLFNFNKSLLFAANSGMFRVDYIPVINEEMTIITVYKCNSVTSEQNIWTISFDSANIANLTTQYIKTISTKIKYADTTSIKALINTTRPKWKNITDTLGNYILLGSSDSLNYSGKLAEFMLFDKYLDKIELLKIHTYLAIKYGVSLFKSDYVNSLDSVIWNYQENINYSKEIAGIGKDTTLGLNQKQSSADGGDNSLCIAANTKQPSNQLNTYALNQGDFLVWSSNGKNINDTISEGRTLNQISNLPSKKWLMQVSGNTSRLIPTQIVLNGSQIDSIGQCFLVIDRSATSNFSIENSQLIKADSIDSNKNIYFSNIYWDIDQSGKDMFTFLLGNKLTLLATALNCTTNTLGVIDVEIVGGTPPFTYSLTPDTIQNMMLWNSNERAQTKNNLLSGKYIAKVIDIKGATDKQTVEILVSDNATTFSTTSNKLSALNTSTPEYSVYPNPTRGEYTVNIKLAEISQIMIRVIDETGKLIDEKIESGSNRYKINGVIKGKGSYYIEITTSCEKKLFKLVVV